MNILISRQPKGIYLRWAVVLLITLSLLLGFSYPLTAKEGRGDALNLTLEEVRELAVAQNTDLELFRLSLDKGELSLELLEQSKQDVQSEWDNLLDFLEQIKQVLPQPEDGDGEAEVQPPQGQEELANIQEELTNILEASLEQMDHLYMQQLENQEQQVRQSLEEGEEMLQLQEEMVLFQVESLFVAGLILKQQILLQETVITQLNSLLEAEQTKKGAGYNSLLQVEEAAAKLREAEAAYRTLEQKLAETIDELLLSCGLAPGTKVVLKPFNPRSPQQVSLDKAISTSLSSGWLVESKRRQVDLRREELKNNEDTYGKDSPQYRLAEIDLRQATLEVEQAQDQTRAAVRRSYLALVEQEQLLRKAEQDIKLGALRQETLSVQQQCGYITAAEALAGSLAVQQAETELFTVRYRYHLAYQEFDLARRGYIMTSAMGLVR